MIATIPAAAFERFPAAASAFYAGLEEPGNNATSWLDANRARYHRDVRWPLEPAGAHEDGTPA